MFNGRECWNKFVGMRDKPLFDRWKNINYQLFLMLQDLNDRNGLKAKGEKVLLNNMMKRYIDMSAHEMGGEMIKDFYALQRCAYRFHKEIAEQNIYDCDEIAKRGYPEHKYLQCIKTFSEIMVFAYPIECPDIPPQVMEMYKDLASDMPDLSEISINDLAENPRDRVPVVFIIDNALYMGKNGKIALNTLKDSFDQLIEGIRKSPQLSESIELFVATCGGGFNQIVDFATIDRQDLELYTMSLTPKGRCMMGAAINGALDKLQERIKKYSNEHVRCFRPWLIILSNGSFVDMESEGAYDRLDEMRRRNELKVYPVGITNEANIKNLRMINSDEAGIVNSFDGFFKDVFTSLQASQHSEPDDDQVGLVHTNGWTRTVDE